MRRIALFALLLATFVSLIGCGSGTDPKDEAAKAAQSGGAKAKVADDLKPE
jgi:hypothetical protein